MQNDVWIDARSLSRPFITGWERYVHELALGLKDFSNINFYPINTKSKLNLILSDFSFPKKSKGFKVSHFPTYPPFFRSSSDFQIITIHDLTWWKFPKFSSLLGKTYYKSNMQRAINNSSGFITPSRSIKEDLLNWFKIKEELIKVIPHGNSLPKGFISNIDKPYFLSIGTIEPRKNLDFYAHAIIKSNLQKEFDFVHVGRNAWGELPKIFKHVNAKSDQDLANLISNAHCVVIPSKYEGFGFPVLEAHYQNKSVLMSNDKSLCEQKLESDLVFELDNLDSLIKNIIKASQRVNNLDETEKQNIKNYSWKTSVNQHLDFYRSYL